MLTTNVTNNKAQCSRRVMQRTLQNMSSFHHCSRIITTKLCKSHNHDHTGRTTTVPRLHAK